MDQLLSGMKDEKLASELLAKADLAQATVVEAVINKEQAEKEAQTMAMCGGGPSAVNSVKPTFNRTINQPYLCEGTKQLRCKRCGLKGHDASKCEVKCFICSKVGHIGENCRSKNGKQVHNEQQSDSEFAS